jgi:hypothetical protein
MTKNTTCHLLSSVCPPCNISVNTANNRRFHETISCGVYGSLYAKHTVFRNAALLQLYWNRLKSQPFLIKQDPVCFCRGGFLNESWARSPELLCSVQHGDQNP